jgi:branched-chain amino acid transport system substrate-binding protein
MRRRYLLLLVIGLVIGRPWAASADIVIGLAYPLSGPYALTGHRNKIAVEMAVRDINENGGVLGEQVSLVAVDDGCGLERSLEAARKLIGAGVHAVIGHMCSHSSLLAAGLYETADVLMITPGSTHPRLTEEGRRNVFRLIGRDDRQGELAGDFLADGWPGEKIAILHDGSTYGEGLAAAARKRLRARDEVEAIYDFYVPGQEDFTDLVARLRRERIAVLYMGGYGPDAGWIVRTARQQGYDLQVIGGDGLGMDEFWSIAREAGDGTVYSDRPDATGAADGLLKRFRSRGLGTRGGGLGAYAAVQVWAQAVERVGTVRVAEVAKVLRRTRFDTVLGPVSFDQKGDCEGAKWQWKVWSDGIRVPLSRRAVTQSIAPRR